MTDDDLPTLPPASQSQGNPGHDSADRVARGAELLRLRMLGMSYDQIAEQAGYSDKGAARHALMRALDRHEAENAAQLRHIENLRLDADERVLRSIIGDASLSASARIRAIDSRTRLSARRARMNGLDAPVAVQISAGVAAGLEDALRELDEAVGDVLQFPGRATVPGEVLDSTDDEAQEA